MYGLLYLMLFQMQAKFITDAFFSNMFSHSTHKWGVEARKATAITTRVLETKYLFNYMPKILKNFLKVQCLNKNFSFHISNE